MCGIVGILSRYQQQERELKNALKCLYHRGPNDQGIYSDRQISLGHTRLSILDLSHLGHQPMNYQNERFWITFNGEIYNYLELRQELINLGYQFLSQTDTEVLLAAYVQWGTACLDKLRGMFAFGIWDRQQQSLFLARDRLGEKPLYYCQKDNYFYFASELKALISLLPNLPELNPVAVDWYLHYQYVPEPATPLAGITKLAAAHYLVISADNWQNQPQSYWSLGQIPPLTGDPVALIRHELEQTIELTLRSDVPVGVALSGGIDSSAIAALAAPKYKDTLQAFSVGYPGRPEYDERQQAEDLAKSFGLPFLEIELHTEDLVNFFPDLVSILDDPIADIASYGHYAVMKLAADQGVKVMLSGIGGDELFWGYPWVVQAVRLTQNKQTLLKKQTLPLGFWHSLKQFTHHPFYQKLTRTNKFPASVRALLYQGFEMSFLGPQYPEHAVYQELVPDFQTVLRYHGNIYTDEFARQIPLNNAYRPFEVNLSQLEDIPRKISELLFNTWLVSNCLSLGDRLSMASSVETRLPLLDYKLIELVMGLGKTQPDHGLGHKFWLKSALKGIIPDEILNRPKRGFQPPTKEWMKAIINHYLTWLTDGYLVQMQVINQTYLNKMLREFTNKQEHGFMLYKMLLLEIWYRKVVVQE